MGKRAALISGLVVVAVITAGVLSWREFAVGFQVYRMRRSPDYLVRVIDSPEQTIAGQAVRRIFASGDFPGTRLLQAYFEGVDEDLRRLLDSHYDEQRLFIDSVGEFHLLGLSDKPELVGGFPWQITRDSGGVTDIWPSVVIQALLAEVHYRCSDFPDYPEAVFSFHPSGEASPPGSLMSRQKPPDQPYCLVQWPKKR